MLDSPWLDAPAGWLAANVWLWLPVLALLLIGGAIALGVSLRRRRAAALALALGDSTRGNLRFAQPLSAAGFQALIAPPPDPFVELSVRLALAGGRSPAAAALWPVGGRGQSLGFAGRFRRPPTAELLWARGHLPDRALGRGVGTQLWVARRLDFLEGEYTVRGKNPAAVEHAFVELQTRFGAFLQRVSVQADPAPALDVLLDTAGLNAEEVPALVERVRALARGALVE
jgi:hypothetical protein